MAKIKVKNTTALGFEEQLWQAACVLWGHIPAADYRKIIIGLIFLKYISSVFEERYEQLRFEGEGFEDDKDAYLAEHIFYVPAKARWQVIAEQSHSPKIGQVIDDAMRAIEHENVTLQGVLPKTYAQAGVDKRVLGEVVDVFSNIEMKREGEERDLLGRAYEYCISHFAEYEGKKGGEFYTPTCIVKTLVAVLKPKENSRIYDPCCGSGGMFVQSAEFVKQHQGRRGTISVFGQEANPDTWKMAKINLAIRGLNADLGPSNADTFFNDVHADKKMDYILANPPFNLKAWGGERLTEDVRWKYGVPPEGNANYAWIQHMISHLSARGRIGLVLANGALTSTTTAEGSIREAILKADLVEGIVALPDKLFYTTGIPVSLWFLGKEKKRRGELLFVDARKLGEMVSRKLRVLTDADIERIAETFAAFEEGRLEPVKGFSAAVKREDVLKQPGCPLTPGRYVGIEDAPEEDEPFEAKMTRLTAELSDLFAQSHALEARIRQNLHTIGFEVK